MRRIIRSIALCFAIGLVLSPITVSAKEFTDFTDWARDQNSTPQAGTQAAGDTIEAPAPTGWAFSPIGLAFDYFDPTKIWFFHESEPASGIWQVDVASPHGATPLTYSKPASPSQNTDGGSIRPSDGYIYAADFNGDLSNIDDNIHLFDRDGNTIAYWETDVGIAGTPCSGGVVDQIVDVAYDHNQSGILYATNASDNTIYSIDVSDESGGASSNSACTVAAVATAPAPIGNVVAIEYDFCNQGYWLADFNSNNVVLVADDGSFNTVLTSFTADSGVGFNTGISPQVNGDDPLPIWLTDFGSASFSIFDSGSEGCRRFPPRPPQIVPTLQPAMLATLGLLMGILGLMMARARAA